LQSLFGSEWRADDRTRLPAFRRLYEKMSADRLVVAHFDVPVPGPHESADSVRQRNAFDAGLKELRFRAIAPGIGSFTGYRAEQK
jgi:hypothetical protein